MVALGWVKMPDGTAWHATVGEDVMRIAGFVLAVLLAVPPSTALAQIADCDESLWPGVVEAPGHGMIYVYGVVPAVPTSATAFRVDTGRPDFDVQSVTATVTGHAIDLVATGHFMGWDPPPTTQCISTTIDALPAGTYTLSTEFREDGAAETAPAVTITIVAGGGGGGPAPVAAPALSSLALAALAGLLCVLGWSTLRRRAGD
jgi:hypothetical protein